MKINRLFSRKMLPLFTLMFVLSVSATSIQFGSAAKNNPDDIFITVKDSSFAPLTTVSGNQVLVTVDYNLNGGSLKGEKINGLMEIFYSNGTLLKSSSYPDGFKVKKKDGTIDFKTTIKDPLITDVIANITFTDLKKTKILSNTITVNVVLHSDEIGITNDTEEG